MAGEVCDLLCLDLVRAEELRTTRLDKRSARRLADPFRALADPTRLMLAIALRDGGELCVCDLAWVLEQAQNLVSHHLRALRSGGLVEYRREGKMALYSLTAAGRALLGLVGVEEAVPGGLSVVG